MLKITLALMLMCASLNAQDITYKMVQDSKMKTQASFASYTAQDGTVFKVGDVLTINKPSNGLKFSNIFTGDGGFLQFEEANYKAAGKKVQISEIVVHGAPSYGFRAMARVRKFMVAIEGAHATGEITR